MLQSPSHVACCSLALSGFLLGKPSSSKQEVLAEVFAKLQEVQLKPAFARPGEDRKHAWLDLGLEH